MKRLLLFSCLLLSSISFSQDLRSLKKLKPTERFENIHVQKISEDSLQSVFVIWVENDVSEHFHAEHTENIYVISGKAMMSLGDSSFVIRKGDRLTIPKGTPHSVTKVYGRKLLKILSIQSPKFDGSDRIFTESKQL